MKTVSEVLTLIESWFVDTVEPDGVIMHHIDDTEWQEFKRRLLQQIGEK